MNQNSDAGGFTYDIAFSRNIGWVTEEEQQRLRSCRVAVGGLGGVGGSHLITLARLGIGAFTITDMDSFDWPNLNRQAGALVTTIGKQKLDVMAGQVRGINPSVELRLMPNGLDPKNIDEFLAGASLYMDSLDIFALDIRRRVFARCAELGIPAITAAPMGLGTALLVFDPSGMHFDDYFGFEGHTFEDQILKFIVGVSPSMTQRHYLLSRTSVSLFKRKVPSIAMGIELAAGVACSTALKVLLKRGSIRYAPRGLHFDAYQNRLVKTWRPFGARNPLQKLMFWHIRRLLGRSA